MLFVVVLTFNVLLVMLKLICLSMTAPRAFVLFLCFFFLLFFTVILGLSVFHISFILFGVVVFISVLCGIIENVGHFYM